MTIRIHGVNVVALTIGAIMRPFTIMTESVSSFHRFAKGHLKNDFKF